KVFLLVPLVALDAQAFDFRRVRRALLVDEVGKNALGTGRARFRIEPIHQPKNDQHADQDADEDVCGLEVHGRDLRGAKYGDNLLKPTHGHAWAWRSSGGARPKRPGRRRRWRPTSGRTADPSCG